MTNYRLNDSMPSVAILSRNSRSSSLDETKNYQNNTIFLEDRQEFAIRLFNPLSEKVGVHIGLNKKFSNNLLILNPGEVATLDRFVDDKKRMIFETYTYDKGNESSKKAVESNGIVEVKFFKEKIQPTLNYTDSSTTIDWVNLNLPDSNYLYLSGSTGNIGIGSTTPNTNINFNMDFSKDYWFPSGGGYAPDIDTSGESKKGKGKRKRKSKGLPHYKSTKLSGILTNTDTKNSNSRTYTAQQYSATLGNVAGMGAVCNPLSYGQFDLEESIAKVDLEETGRIEKGTNSEQDFHRVEIEFELHPFHTVEFNLKPISQKGQHETEIREYCPTCKYRVRNNKWNFCPKCSEDLSQL